MTIFRQFRQSIAALMVVFVMLLTTSCSGVAAQAPKPGAAATLERSVEYGQLARGDSAAGQEFGDWVVEASKGLVKDAFVRDSNKLGAVISSQVRPNEVKALAQSLAQGFRKNFPNQDLTVLMYSPDKELILTARYDAQSKQINYSAS